MLELELVKRVPTHGLVARALFILKGKIVENLR